MSLDKLWDLHKRDIMERLQRVIPEPAKPMAKPTKSFRGLKPGDLVSKDGKEYKVTLVDSLHASVVGISPLATDQTILEEAILGVDWTSHYAKIPKRRKNSATKGSEGE